MLNVEATGRLKARVSAGRRADKLEMNSVEGNRRARFFPEWKIEWRSPHNGGHRAHLHTYT